MFCLHQVCLHRVCLHRVCLHRSLVQCLFVFVFDLYSGLFSVCLVFVCIRFWFVFDLFCARTKALASPSGLIWPRIDFVWVWDHSWWRWKLANVAGKQVHKQFGQDMLDGSVWFACQCASSRSTTPTIEQHQHENIFVGVLERELSSLYCCFIMFHINFHLPKLTHSLHCSCIIFSSFHTCHVSSSSNYCPLFCHPSIFPLAQLSSIHTSTWPFFYLLNPGVGILVLLLS